MMNDWGNSIKIFRFIMQNTGKRCMILLVFIILRSNVFRYNKILIDCVFGNSKFVVPSTLTIDLGFASVNIYIVSVLGTTNLLFLHTQSISIYNIIFLSFYNNTIQYFYLSIIIQYNIFIFL